jgi:hypothetical protein
MFRDLDVAVCGGGWSLIFSVRSWAGPAVAPGGRGSTGPRVSFVLAGTVRAGQPGARVCRRLIAVVIWVAQGQVMGEAQPPAAAAGDDPPGGGEQAQPQAFGFPGPGGAVQGEHRHPGGQFTGHGDELAPDLVLGEAVQGKGCAARCL